MISISVDLVESPPSSADDGSSARFLDECRERDGLHGRWRGLGSGGDWRGSWINRVRFVRLISVGFG